MSAQSIIQAATSKLDTGVILLKKFGIPSTTIAEGLMRFTIDFCYQTGYLNPEIKFAEIAKIEFIRRTYTPRKI